MQMHTQRMLETHPRKSDGIAGALGAAASACCICLDIDCADICGLTGRVLSRVSNTQHRPFTSLVQACAEVCKACAENCEKHQHHAHCQVCAEACRDCERACNQLAGGMMH